MKRRSIKDTPANRHALDGLCVAFTTNSTKSKLYMYLSNYDFHVIKRDIPDKIKKSIKEYVYSEWN